MIRGKEKVDLYGNWSRIIPDIMIVDLGSVYSKEKGRKYDTKFI